MDSGTQYKGSQAFAHILNVGDESINPNTGTLHITKLLADLRGVVSSIDLKLNLTYNPGTHGTFGLPPGWGLDLPCVLPGKSLTTSGRTFVIDAGWADSTDYHSGLKYLNNHGIRFEFVDPPLSLPSGQPGSFSFRLQHEDGSIDYFDLQGKPIEHDDIFGNYIYIAYVQDGQNVFASNLEIAYILDSWQQKVTFQYDAGSGLTVSLPDGGNFQLSFNSESLSGFKDAADYMTNFNYITPPYQPPQQVISDITYPSGLFSQFEYIGIPFTSAEGQKGFFPAVSDAWKHDSSGQELQHVNYRYGTASNGFFTGANIGLRMDVQNDTLVASVYTNYSYDVFVTDYVTQKDGTDLALSATCTWFNYLHLPIKEQRRNVDEKGQPTPAYETIYSYSISDDLRDRTPYYTNPKSVEQFHILDVQAETYIPSSKKSFLYNNNGNLTSVLEELQGSDGTYKAQQTTSRDYVTVKHSDAWSTQMLIQEQLTDEITKTASLTTYTLNENQTFISKAATSSSSIDSEGNLVVTPWQERSYSCDANGRILGETHAWSPGTNPPTGTILSTAKATAYHFDNGILTESTTDPLGNVTLTQIDMRRPGAPIIKNTLPLGQSETFEFDSVGRLIQHTNALGYKTTVDYEISSSSNTQTVTNPQNYVKRSVLDPLGRTIQVVDNGGGNEGSSGGVVSRIISQTQYDNLSRIVQTTDISGLTTKYTFDGISRPLQTTDADENVIFRQYDDTKLQVLKTVNTIASSLTILDGLGKIVHEITYPDPWDTTSSVMMTTHTYDGLARIITQTRATNTGPLQENVPVTIAVLENQTRSFDLGSLSVVESKTAGPFGSSADTTTRQIVRDLFGNEHTYSRTTSYSDGPSFQHTGPLKVYNPINQLHTLCNQLGQEETNFYDENGWLSQTNRFDGTAVKYVRDSNGRVTSTSTPNGAQEITYLPDGSISKLQEGSQTIQYTYALDGAKTSIVFEDGRVHKFNLDQSSRVVGEVDVFGVVRSTTYNANGHVEKQSCQNDTLSYVYGTVNNTKGQLIQKSLAGNQPNTQDFSYDGYGRLTEANVQNLQTRTQVLKTEYTYSDQSQIASVISNSALHPSLNKQRTFTYDGLGQLGSEVVVGDSPSTTTYKYGGNSNIISRSIQESGIQMMSYNSIDQRTDSGIEWDENGRLVKDSTGRKYSFDDRDRLLVVSLPETESNFTYHPDNSLSLVASPLESSKLYSNGKKVSAIESAKNNETSQNSLFSKGQKIIATYKNSGESDYFFDQLGSTSLISGTQHSTTTSYDAYGAAQTETPVAPESNFGYNQELSDPNSGLIFMLSRFYNPDHMCFISMDTYLKENRYAFCSGDPINFADPSGHDALDVLGFVLGFAASVAVGPWVCGITEQFLMFRLGASAVTASIGAGMLSGAAAGFAGGFVNSMATGHGYSVGQLGRDVAIGAIGGLAGSSATATAVRRGANMITAGVIGGGVGGLAQELSASWLAGEPVNAWRLALAAAGGVAMDAIATRGYTRRMPAVEEVQPGQPLNDIVRADSSSSSGKSSLSTANRNTSPEEDFGAVLRDRLSRLQRGIDALHNPNPVITWPW